MAPAQDLQHRRQQLRKAVDEGIADGDAVSAYHELVRFMLEKMPEDKQGLIALLREATGAYKDDPTFKNDANYLKLWTIYSTKVDRPAAVYSYLLKKGIGTVWGKTFEEYAVVLERQGEWAKADAVYRDGIGRNVKGLSKLKERYAAFQARAPPGSTTATEPAQSSSSTSAQPIVTSSLRIGTAKPGHKRYAYIKAHLKSGGAPAPGKRPEKFAFDFGALYTPDTGEFSWEEVRARHMGVLGRQWPQDPVEPPFAPAPVMGTVVPPSPAHSTPPSSPARVPVDFNGGLTTTRRAIGAEPTVTINTKEALADVFGMYNSPENTVRHRQLPGSKHAPIRKVEPAAVPAPTARPLARTLSNENSGALNGSRSNISFAPFVDGENRERENPLQGSARAKTPTSFKPFVDGDGDEDMDTPQKASFRPFIDEEAAAATAAAASVIRGSAFQPFVDENAGAQSRSHSLRQPILEEEEEDDEMPQAQAVRSKTPTFRPFTDGSDDNHERSRTPRSFGDSLPTQTPSFRPFVDENAGPTASTKDHDSRTPTAPKSKPFAETDRSNRAPFTSVPSSSVPSSPKPTSVDESPSVAEEDVIEVEGENDTEQLPSVSTAASTSISHKNGQADVGRSNFASWESASATRSGPGRTSSRSAVAFTEEESTSAKPSVFVSHTRAASQSSDIVSPTEERARAPSSGPFGFGGSVFSKPGAKSGATPFRPQRTPRAQGGANALPSIAAQGSARARAPLQAVPARPVTPPPPAEEDDVEKDGGGGLGSYAEEGSSHRQIVSRCGGVFEALTPIAERTMEYTAASSLRTPLASPSWHRSECAARNAGRRLAAEIAEEDEEDEEQYAVEDKGPLPRSVSPGVSASLPLEMPTLDVVPNPCNPFEMEIMMSLLAAQPGERGYHDCTNQEVNLLADLQKFSKKVQGNTFPITLSNRRFVVTGKLGEGGFGDVFQAKDCGVRPDDAEDESEDEDEDEDEEEDEDQNLVALKVVRPRNKWEFHAIRRAHSALPADARRSIITARELFAFHDESFLVLDLHSHGTLLDVVNSAGALGFTRAGAPLDEALVMFFGIELLRTLGALHYAGLIHGDLKIDNCLVRLDTADTDWSRQYAPDGSGGWASKGIALVDFGRMINTRAFPEGQQFVGDWPVEARDCAEMRDGLPWTYETDYFGLAGVLYTLLYGKHVDASAFVRDGPEGRQRLALPLKRYWQGDLWGSLFDVLLNPRTVRPGGELPLVKELAALRVEMEAWLEKNCMKAGVNLQAMLKKIERGVIA